MRSPWSLRICICVCICICACICICCLAICIFANCICTAICSCPCISVHTKITALVRWIVFLTTWLCICHRFVDMYFSRPDFVFLSQMLHISKWHHSGNGGPIRVFKEAKPIRIKFPKTWARCLITEIMCCCSRPDSMPQNGSGKAETPEERLSRLIFSRLHINVEPRSIRPSFKLGDSNSGLKLSIYMAYQGLNLRDLARSCQFNLRTVKVMDSPATPLCSSGRAEQPWNWSKTPLNPLKSPRIKVRPTCSRVRASAKLTEGLWG